MTYQWKKALAGLILSAITIGLVFAEPYHPGIDFVRTLGVIVTMAMMGLIMIFG